MPPAGNLRDLAPDGDRLWAVTGGGSGGRLWRSDDGAAWEAIQDFDETPIAIAAYQGSVFVGTFAAGGGGLYGPSAASDMRNAVAARPFGALTGQPVPAAFWRRANAAMDAYIKQRSDAEAGLEAVSDALRDLTAFDDPNIGPRLSSRLAALDLSGPVRFFSWNRTRRAHRLAWYLLGAIAVNGHGRVPSHLLALPLSTGKNDRKKNLDTPIAAIAAAGWLGVADQPTLAALFERLRTAKTTPWLRSDLVSALTALTGLDFGHDIERWQRWWTEHQ
jgi:hypothetical protein